MDTPPGIRLPAPGMDYAEAAPAPEPRLAAPASMDAIDGDFGELLPNLLSIILDGTTADLVAGDYYARLARTVRAEDASVLCMASDLVTAVRFAYRTATEHAHHVARVPLRRTCDRKSSAALDADCPVCLKPLRGPGRVVRVRPASSDPRACGHFFHADCFGEWELRSGPGESRHCPMCRADLGAAVRFWADHESGVPRF